MSDARRRPDAVVLLSGGLDSYTAAAMVAADGFALNALTIRYGQVHAREVEAARAVAAALGVRRHIELDLDLRGVAASALTGASAVPKDRPIDESIPVDLRAGPQHDLPVAGAGLGRDARRQRPRHRRQRARLFGLSRIAGPNTSPRSRRWRRSPPRPASQGGRLQIHTPLVSLSKADIIRRGLALGLDYGLTHSCYDPRPDGRPCGRCDSCVLRAKGFAEAGVARSRALAAESQLATRSRSD